MHLALLLTWWNLIYVVPFGLAVTYLALYVFTGITFGDADADMDANAEMEGGQIHVEAHVVEADADADMEHDIAAEHDVDADHDLEGDADQDTDSNNASSLALSSGPTTLAHSMPEHEVHNEHAATGPSFVQSLLSLLGVGKIPLSLVLMILLLLWGSIGFILNQLITSLMGPIFIVGLITLPITAIVSLALTGLAARIIGKFLPTMETYANRWHQLVGRAGEAIFDINATFGMASVRDNHGDLFQVPCRTADGKPVIPKGSRIVLFEYDPDKGVFHVAPLAL